MPEARLAPEAIGEAVRKALACVPVVDMHTHLYPPSFGTPLRGRSGPDADPRGLMLWGIDELLTYHYLTAEVFRTVPASRMPYEQFWRLSKREQADHIWRHLFVERVPLSEACRGVLTVIQKLGLDPSDPTPDGWRAHFDSLDADEYIDRVMEIANVSSITMTNNVFDDNERERWLADASVGDDPRFRAVLRIDPLLLDWAASAEKLAGWGYAVETRISPSTLEGVRRFLEDWLERTKAIYVAVSLPPEWRYPATDAAPLGIAGTQILERVLLRVCAERNLPFAMMIGCRRGVNPALRDAGDLGAPADVESLTNLCRNFGDNRFLVTMLSRENQHDLAVAARKFGNLMPFGCWWFLNNPGLIEEITRMRLELLGTTFIPQHSDARVLDQLIYKWEHSRQALAKVLTEKFTCLAQTGRGVNAHDVNRAVRAMFSGNFEQFLAG